ncbi:MAG: AMP-binding protein [Anaerolineales bacterium]|jgi:acyl-CoA synthetase (AMP-forming)/AMP-acid ligase II
MSTLGRRFQSNFEGNPEKICLRLIDHDGRRDLTWRDLLRGASGYAGALNKAGIEPGEPVVIILEHGADLIFAFLGGILHGSIPSIMPFLTEKLSPERYRQSLAALVEITRPACIVTYPEFGPEVEQALAGGSSVRQVLFSHEIVPSPRVDFEELDGIDVEEDAIVLLQHSSGTTGLQKGVALSHRAVMTQVEAYAQAISMTADDVVVSWLPLYHDMGLIAGFLMPLLLDSALVLMSPFDWVRAPYMLMQAVSQFNGTLSWLPNFAYNFCAQKIRDKDLEGVDLASWRAVINCSEPMRFESHQAFQERFAPYGLNGEALATCYAMAENVFAVSQGGMEGPVTVDEIDRRAFQEDRLAAAPDEGAVIKMLSAGRPIPGTEVRILDDDRSPLPERRIGEIALRSNCMLSGYFHRQDLTDKAFHDGWYLTGDLGYLADGELYVSGRIKELIIVGGKNVYPQDLEELTYDVDGVYPGRAVAFGVFNEKMGTEDVAVVAEVETTDPDELRSITNGIRAAIAKGSDVAVRYIELVPRGWMIKTSSGKPARNANRDKYLAQRT